MKPQACTCHFILITVFTEILLQSHKYKMAHNHEVLYEYKSLNQHANLLEANEDDKAQMVCAHFYQTAVLNLCIIYNVFLGTEESSIVQP